MDSWEEESQEEKIVPLSAPPPMPSRGIQLRGSSGGGDDSIWLTSYADLMTLIACFFILMVAFANFDPAGFASKANELSQSFTKGGTEKQKELQHEMDKLYEAVITEKSLSDVLKVHREVDGLSLSFSGTALFKAGQADFHPEVREALDIIISLVLEKSKESRVIVEGHTDETPLVNSSKYLNNWELASARASRVVQRFEDFGFSNKNLISVGYGSTRPVLPNYDENGKALLENMDQNRRVVIKVFNPPPKVKGQKLGLGVYFEDVALSDK